MNSKHKHLAVTMLMLSAAGAQTGGSAELRNVAATRDGNNVRIEITLSARVKPSVETATNPSRILLDLPGTTCNQGANTVPINLGGVLRVRTAQHSTKPPVTRVVLDLDQTHPYVVTADGNRVILTIDTTEKKRASSSGAPVAATSGNLISIFRRRREKAPVIGDQSGSNAESLPTPPPTPSGPAFEPPSDKPSVQAGSPPLASTPPSEVGSSSAEGSGANPVFDPAQGAAKKPATDQSSEKDEIAAVVPPEKVPPVTDSPIKPVAAEPANLSVSPRNESATTAETASTTAKPEATMIARTDDPSLRTVFRVKYVAEGVAYLEGGRAQGLSEGMKLEIRDSDLPAKQGESVNTADPRIVAELQVSAVAEMSAVTDIHNSKRPVKVGDLAYLSSDDAAALVQQRTMSATRQYPAVISFTEGDTLDEEARDEVPKPPLPSVNRARGRIGFDSIETFTHGSTPVTSSDVGMVFRGDITRIGGTYWNLSGYWRGELTKQSAITQQTLQNLINRTYHLEMTYDNPNSSLVAGFGRLYLPWAPSLDTIDGGYFGKRLSKGTVLGVFGGSTPDPSSWDYSPNRVMSGAFVNFEGGEYDGFHYSATSGAGVSMVNWQMDRPFVFFEDSISYKRTIALYESAQVDSPSGNSVAAAPGFGLGRNFFTLRVNPVHRVEADFNYNYFRDVPTFDPTLVGTSLLDKYLFQGFSAGGRVEVWNQIWVSTVLGRSSGTGDAKASLNQMYGLTFGRLPLFQLRADAHYAKFDSSFGSGSYESFSLSRQMSDRLRLEVLLGQQNFASTLTTANRARFVTGTVETTLGPHYYLQGNFTTNRGDMSYDQLMFSIGYRFDNRRKHE
ncbi:MAG TPA: AMIN domain-containing protein [Candidatus Sulfotelmatobacter sp.]|nr:AMIN domain-containing protein [Candidatus Sulfotelmatobacter sp.]